jgi:hypothetical protein
VPAKSSAHPAPHHPPTSLATQRKHPQGGFLHPVRFFGSFWPSPPVDPLHHPSQRSFRPSASREHRDTLPFCGLNHRKPGFLHLLQL